MTAEELEYDELVEDEEDVVNDEVVISRAGQPSYKKEVRKQDEKTRVHNEGTTGIHEKDSRYL